MAYMRQSISIATYLAADNSRLQSDMLSTVGEV